MAFTGPNHLSIATVRCISSNMTNAALILIIIILNAFLIQDSSYS